MSSSSDFLGTILNRRRERIAEMRRTIRLEDLCEQAHALRSEQSEHRLRAALNRKNIVNIIAEIKRASPSKGTIKEDVFPAALASDYAEGGACAISVLTEGDYFRGSLDDLREVRAGVSLPLLRKDFILDESQIYEAAAAGADAVLLIVRALTDTELVSLRRLTEDELKMDALVEVHTEEEMSRAAATGSTLIGVNNRNLDTFDVTLETSIILARNAPAGATLVSESGLRTSADLSRLRACGYHGFLIGESLMRSAEPSRALRELIREVAIAEA